MDYLQWSATLAIYVTPVFGHLRADVVDTGLVFKALQLIGTAKAETASRVRGRLECILDWPGCVATGTAGTRNVASRSFAAEEVQGGEFIIRGNEHLGEGLASRRRDLALMHTAVL